jgi:hypothetical protein
MNTHWALTSLLDLLELLFLQFIHGLFIVSLNFAISHLFCLQRVPIGRAILLVQALQKISNINQ